MKAFINLWLLLLSLNTVAQLKPTSAENVQQALKQKNKLNSSSFVKKTTFQNIGPTVMSGRVVDIDVNPYNTIEFYVAYASGGLWYTKNNGNSFSPILDNSQTQNIGDIAVDWKKNIIWVGTGENNSSRSSYAGIGILKSTDNGKNWKNMGLYDSHHIGKILINPNNTDEVVLGVIGHLYSKNIERGIFRTTDGGETWHNTLFIDNKTGVIDIQQVPGNFNILFAASWERERKAWNFEGDGPRSAVYKSIDAGKSWKKISTNNGFPEGEGIGRIGLAVFDENKVYAILDNQSRRKEEKSTSNTLTKKKLISISASDFLNLTNEKLNTYLKTNGFHKKYNAKNIKQKVRSGSKKPIDLVKYLDNANALLFNRPVIGAQVYKTINGGNSWRKTHNGYLDDLYYSYGYYFGEIRADPQNENKIYALGVPILKSNDGGKTFFSISKENVHADHQTLWINPNRSGHLIDGNDGGLNISYDDGENWIKLNSPAVGQFYSVYADNQKNYKIYGGLQDNGVWVANNNAEINKSWKQSGKNPYENLIGGDGMQIAVDNRDPNIVYTGYQFGNYYRINRKTKTQKHIQPKHDLGEHPFRFNWQTPILLSKHNQDILYLGGNKLHRSLNQGNSWETISKDLTQGEKEGNVAYGTLTTISESPYKFGLIYVGSDDGLIHITKNSGGSWERISKNLPKNLWVSRIIASKHKQERVYATLNGYRFDNFKSYIYKSDNYGKDWVNISHNIPNSPVNVIKEDPLKENVLYVGTDNGAYITFDDGKNWNPFSKIPNVAIHDLVIQPKAKELILATHGRSLYKTKISHFQQLKNTKENFLFPINDIDKKPSWGSSWSKWSKANIPKQIITFFSNSDKKLTLNIKSKNTTVNQIITNLSRGFNYIVYDLTFSKKGKIDYLNYEKKAEIKKADNNMYYLPKGKYTVESSSKKQTFEIK